MRRRHGCSALESITTTEGRAQDVHTGSCDIDRRHAIVREVRQLISVIGSCNRNNSVERETNRIKWLLIVVCPVVSSRRHECNADVNGRLNCILEGLRKSWSAVTVIADNNIDAILGLHRDQIVQGFDRSQERNARTSSTDLERHDLGVPVDPGDSSTVVSNRRGRTRDVRAVTVLIQRIRIAREWVNTVNVIDVTVGIVVNSIPSDLAWVDPHIGPQIRVIVVNS